MRIPLYFCIAALGIGVAVGGEKGAKIGKVGKDVKMPTDQLPGEISYDFARFLRTISRLPLTEEETVKTRELGRRCREMLCEEIEKAQAAAKEKFIEDMRTVLSEEHTAQLDMLVASMKKRDAAVAAAADRFNARLEELGLEQLKGARNEQELTQRLCDSIDGLKGSYKNARGKYERESKDALVQLAKPDAKDKEGWLAYQEAKDELRKKAEAKTLEEVRNLLTDEQKLVLAQAVEAQKEWAQAVEDAESAYKREVDAIAPRAAKK